MKALLIGGAIAALSMASIAAAAQPAPPPPPGVAQGTAPAMQAPMPPPPGMPQMRVQIMSDHVMSRDEVAKHVGKLFARLDTNHDGFITKDELEAVHAKMEAAMVKVGDAEHQLADHGVMIGDRNAIFDRLDTNHDGNISRQEFMSGNPRMRQERVIVMRGPDGAPGAGAPVPPLDGHPGMEMKMHMHGMGVGGFGMRLFEMADSNHDGRVSLAEAQAAALAHFDKADLNHDGKITPEERAQVHQEMRIEHHPS